MDNLKTVSDNIDSIITNANGPGSITAAQHNALMKSMLTKAGKYTGLPFISKRESAAGVISAGSLIWNANAMNDENDFTLTLSNLTSDSNNVERIIKTLSLNTIIHFKDFVGRSVYLIYKGYVKSVDANNDEVLNLTVSGYADNINYTYQAADEYVCFLEFFINQSTKDIQVFGNDFTLKKHPTNNDPLNSGILENNDFILSGFRDNTTFWSVAQCVDATDKDNENSWTVFNSSEDLVLI